MLKCIGMPKIHMWFTDPPYGILIGKKSKTILEIDILNIEIIRATVQLFNEHSAYNPLVCLASTCKSITLWEEELISGGWKVWGIIYTRPHKYSRGPKNNDMLHQVNIF